MASVSSIALLVTSSTYKRSYKWCSISLISLFTIRQDRVLEFKLWLKIILIFDFGSNTLRTALRNLSTDTVERKLSGRFSPLTAFLPLHNLPFLLRSRSLHFRFAALRFPFRSRSAPLTCCARSRLYVTSYLNCTIWFILKVTMLFLLVSFGWMSTLLMV